MTKRFFVILIASLVVTSMTACGNNAAATSTSAPETTEQYVESQGEGPVQGGIKSDEEIAALQAEEAEYASEETTNTTEYVENENVVGGIDFTDNKKYGTPNIEIINKKAHFDEPKVIVASKYAMLDENVEAVLSSGESVTCDSQKGTYVFYYYVPKTVSQIKRTDDGINDLLYEHESVVAARICDKKCENTPYEITVTYEDGTEETITVYVTMK